MHKYRTLTFLQPHEAFPPIHQAWDQASPHPGLLAAGGILDSDTLKQAYLKGIFPWYEEDYPILWWSTDPRMVLYPKEFKLHHSLRKTIRNFIRNPNCSIRISSNFKAVIHNCAAPRTEQAGTWITDNIITAYTQLHQQGLAHSIETWINNELVGGLYVVAIGQAIFGESMFTKQANASKIALAALVCLCLAQQVSLVDCQQETRHMSSLGARTIRRQEFIAHLETACNKPSLSWNFSPRLWQQIL